MRSILRSPAGCASHFQKPFSLLVPKGRLRNFTIRDLYFSCAFVQSHPSAAPATSPVLHSSACSIFAPPVPPADTPYPPRAPPHHARTGTPCHSRATSSASSERSADAAAPAPQPSLQYPPAPRHTLYKPRSTSEPAPDKPPPAPAPAHPPAAPKSASHPAHSSKDSKPREPPAQYPPPPSAQSAAHNTSGLRRPPASAPANTSPHPGPSSARSYAVPK